MPRGGESQARSMLMAVASGDETAVCNTMIPGRRPTQAVTMRSSRTSGSSPATEGSNSWIQRMLSETSVPSASATASGKVREVGGA